MSDADVLSIGCCPGATVARSAERRSRPGSEPSHLGRQIQPERRERTIDCMERTEGKEERDSFNHSTLSCPEVAPKLEKSSYATQSVS